MSANKPNPRFGWWPQQSTPAKPGQTVIKITQRVDPATLQLLDEITKLGPVQVTMTKVASPPIPGQLVTITFTADT